MIMSIRDKIIPKPTKMFSQEMYSTSHMLPSNILVELKVIIPTFQ